MRDDIASKILGGKEKKGVSYYLLLTTALCFSISLLLNFRISANNSSISSYESRIKTIEGEIQKLDQKIRQYQRVKKTIGYIEKEKLLDRIGHYSNIKFYDQVGNFTREDNVVFVVISPPTGESITTQEAKNILAWFEKEFGETQVALISIRPMTLAISVK
ncbi:MAG: hypothetical protein QXY99_04635 [Thermoproteota archaeon]